MKKHNTIAWLINTGWSGGKYGIGKRMSLKITRRLVDAIHHDEFLKTEFEEFPYFKFLIPKSCNGVPSEVLNPKNTWQDKADYEKTLKSLSE